MRRPLTRIAAFIVGMSFAVVGFCGLESVTHISDLNSAWPLGSDLASTSDDHIRNIKVALKTDFPNITGAVTVTQAQLNAVGASGVTGIANPTGLIGMSIVNGSATTVTRSDGHTAIDPAIAPTWTGKHIFSAISSGSADGYSVNIDSTIPGLMFTDSDGGTNTKHYFMLANAEAFQLGLYNDAFSSSAAFAFNRTAGAWTSLNFGNATDNPAASFLGTGAFSVGGNLNVGGASNTGGVALRVQNPGNNDVGFEWQRSSATAGVLLSYNRTGASYTALRITSSLPQIDLGGGVVGGVLNTTVSGSTLSSLSLGNATDNPTFSFLGTGATTFSGTVAASGSPMSASATRVMTGLSAVKASTTSRNTTTTLADDPDLVLTVNETGTYDAEALLLMTGATTNTQGLKYQFVYTGTNTLVGCFTLGSVNGAASPPLAAAGALNVATHGTVLIDAGAGQTTDFDMVKCTLVFTTTGTFKLQWAQSTSSGNNSNLKAGSSLILRKRL